METQSGAQSDHLLSGSLYYLVRMDGHQSGKQTDAALRQSRKLHEGGPSLFPNAIDIVFPLWLSFLTLSSVGGLAFVGRCVLSFRRLFFFWIYLSLCFSLLLSSSFLFSTYLLFLSQAVVTTVLASCAGAVGALLVGRIAIGRFDFILPINGAISGLVANSAGSRLLNFYASIIVGGRSERKKKREKQERENRPESGVSLTSFISVSTHPFLFCSLSFSPFFLSFFIPFFVLVVLLMSAWHVGFGGIIYYLGAQVLILWNIDDPLDITGEQQCITHCDVSIADVFPSVLSSVFLHFFNFLFCFFHALPPPPLSSLSFLSLFLSISVCLCVALSSFFFSYSPVMSSSSPAQWSLVDVGGVAIRRGDRGER